MIERFITEIDARWPPEEAEKVVLRVIGSTALMRQAKYVRGTKDSDVFRTSAIDDALAERLMTLAGEGTDLHRRHRIYLQLVPSGIIFQRQLVRWHPAELLNGKLRNFRIEVIDFTMDAKAADLPKYRANFHRVERDVFGVDTPTEIELPEWAENG